MAQRIKDFRREEGYLPFIVRFVVKETVALYPAAGDTLEGVDGLRGMLPGLLAMAAEEIVAG